MAIYTKSDCAGCKYADMVKEERGIVRGDTIVYRNAGAIKCRCKKMSIIMTDEGIMICKNKAGVQ